MFSTWHGTEYFKGLSRKIASNKILHNIAKNPKYDGYQRGLASMVYKSFDKKSEAGVPPMGSNFPVKNESCKIRN